MNPDNGSNRAGPRILTSAGILFLAGVAIIGLQLPSTGGVRLILWGAAFTMAGTVFGFLFGIPRDEGKTVNNNLLEISDWLTKIIVGLGLVQIYKFGDYAHRLTNFMVSTAPEGGGFGVSAAGATAIYFTALGFLHGYLFTRLGINLLLADAGRTISAILQGAQQKSIANVSVKPETKEVKLAPETSAKLTEVADLSLSSLKTPADIVTWAKSNLLLGKYSAALSGYSLVSQLSTGNPRLTAESAMALFGSKKDADTAYDQLLAAKALLTPDSDPQLVKDIFTWITYVSLYRDPPAGYEGSLAAAKEFIAGNPIDSGCAGLLINAACALGQLYSALKAKGNPERLPSIAAKAYELLIAAITLVPTELGAVQDLLKAGGKDDDFKDVDRTNATYLALLSTTPPAAADPTAIRLEY